MNIAQIGNSIKTRMFLSFVILLLFSVGSTLFFINYYIRATRPKPIEVPDTVYQMSKPDALALIQSKVDEERDKTQKRILGASILLLTAQVLVAGGASYLVAKNIVSPLEDINSLMKEINEKMLFKKIELDGSDNLTEITSLATSFNAMMTRLNAAFAAQKEFVENASHEIKTPLTVIKTNLESVLLDSKATRKEITAAIETSINSINFLDKLTEDLLLLSLIEKKQIALSKITLNDIVNEIVKNARILAHKKDQDIVFTPAKKKIYVLAHENLLNRAISNIVENAVKYSPEKSTIQIAMSYEAAKCHIVISDNGKGISKDHQTHIFNRFYRVDKSRSRQTGGTGLGLAITKEIITQFGGSINLLSSPNGSTFTISLPTSPKLQ